MRGKRGKIFHYSYFNTKMIFPSKELKMGENCLFVPKRCFNEMYIAFINWLFKYSHVQEKEYIIYIFGYMSGAVKRCISGIDSKLTAVLGAQWGDQGKGKLVDLLSSKYNIVARFNGGDNAGHTVVKQGVKYALHLVPCGIVSPGTLNLIGNGCVVNLQGMFNELSQLDHNKICYKNRMFISDRAHLITQYHVNQDSQFEKKQSIGTTKKGIGPTYAAKAHRYGLRVGDLKDWNIFLSKYERLAGFYHEQVDKAEIQKFKKFRERLWGENMVVDSVSWINNHMNAGQRVLAEGANAALLDIDLGTYPYVTSSSTSIGGLCTGLGISPKKIETVIGVVKAYTTRVGEGPFPSQQSNEIGAAMQKVGHEFGTTTGRARRCGWLDLNLVRYTSMFNGYDSINITKLDILDQFDEIKVAVEYKLDGKTIEYPPESLAQFGRVQTIYETMKGWKRDTTQVRKKEQLPKEAIDYLKFIEKQINIPISWVGTGPGNDAMVHML